ncbi:nickel transporter [Microvirga sp. W0021]|uniref:Nickel/cobalt efflux system n=1 Tax=Hohaiivirga grylli TaxID=3133970 RepID=A0ABV0BNN0_9HYPH
MNQSASSTDMTITTGRYSLYRTGLMLCAIIVIGVVGALLTWLIWPEAPKVPAKVPFGLAREAAPVTSGIGAYILALQGKFYKTLTDAVLSLKEHGQTIWPLLSVGFLYGVFHAAGPGHGKGVISAYIMASERSLKKGLAVCLAAALLQAIIAIAIIVTAAIILNATARQITQWSDLIEIGSFALIAILGLLMCWRKAGKLLALLAMRHGLEINLSALKCDHVHLPPPEAIDKIHSWREMAGVILAAGLRPCSGALIILVFALSQGVFVAGIAATFMMAVGTAITTGVIAAIAVFAKAFALQLAGGKSSIGPIAIAILELAAAAFVAVLGFSLMAGLWVATGLS